MLRQAGHEAYFAGGCVRDLLRGAVPKDFDVATSAPPDAVQAQFTRTLAIGAAFGVILVRGPRGTEVEVATFRADGRYDDGRRPNTVRFADAREDALRRDFTINGMFLDPATETVHDFVGGQADLAAGVVRAIGDPAQRFAEDKLRLLRAVRFAARLGFALEPGTAAAIRTLAGTLPVVSAERIHAELQMLLEPATRGAAFALLRDTALWPVVFPELPAPQFAAAEKLPAPSPLPVVLAALLGAAEPAVATAIMTRLKAPIADRELAAWLVAERGAVAAAAIGPEHEWKRLLARNWAPPLLALAEARAETEAVAALRQRWDECPPAERWPPQHVTGDVLRAAGFAPGPRFKDWLERLYDLQLDGALPDPAAGVALVRQWAAEG